jgi:sec-independent protein translocase protein TatB
MQKRPGDAAERPTMLSIPHLIVIFIVVLVVFGPEKLPELARNFGKIMAEFRRATGDLRTTFESHMRDLEREADDRRIGANRAAPTLASSPAERTAPSAPIPAGTVAADAPHVAAVAAATETRVPETQPQGSLPPGSEPRDMSPGHHEAIDPATSPAASPGAPPDRAQDPMHDPYLAAIQAELAAEPPVRSSQTPASEPDSEKNSERVRDVRDLPA